LQEDSVRKDVASKLKQTSLQTCRAETNSLFLQLGQQLLVQFSID